MPPVNHNLIICLTDKINRLFEQNDVKSNNKQPIIKIKTCEKKWKECYDRNQKH